MFQGNKEALALLPALRSLRNLLEKARESQEVWETAYALLRSEDSVIEPGPPKQGELTDQMGQQERPPEDEIKDQVDGAVVSEVEEGGEVKHSGAALVALPAFPFTALCPLCPGLRGAKSRWVILEHGNTQSYSLPKSPTGVSGDVRWRRECPTLYHSPTIWSGRGFEGGSTGREVKDTGKFPCRHR